MTPDKVNRYNFHKICSVKCYQTKRRYLNITRNFRSHGSPQIINTLILLLHSRHTTTWNTLKKLIILEGNSPERLSCYLTPLRIVKYHSNKSKKSLPTDCEEMHSRWRGLRRSSEDISFTQKNNQYKSGFAWNRRFLFHCTKIYCACYRQ